MQVWDFLGIPTDETEGKKPLIFSFGLTSSTRHAVPKKRRSRNAEWDAKFIWVGELKTNFLLGYSLLKKYEKVTLFKYSPFNSTLLDVQLTWEKNSKQDEKFS